MKYLLIIFFSTACMLSAQTANLVSYVLEDQHGTIDGISRSSTYISLFWEITRDSKELQFIPGKLTILSDNVLYPEGSWSKRAPRKFINISGYVGIVNFISENNIVKGEHEGHWVHSPRYYYEIDDSLGFKNHEEPLLFRLNLPLENWKEQAMKIGPEYNALSFRFEVPFYSINEEKTDYEEQGLVVLEVEKIEWNKDGEISVERLPYVLPDDFIEFEN
ncbi:MAG: hypothetical protein AB3N10_18250 [Allomuricauda sp.]